MRWAASDCAARAPTTSTRRSRRRWASTTSPSSSTSSSARTRWSGRWWQPARPTTTSRSPATQRRTSTTRWGRWCRNEPPYPLRSRREQAGCVGAGSKSVLASWLQHRLSRGRPDRAARGVAMTIVVNVEELPLEQVTKQLNKLVNVIKIVELDPDASVQRELLLVKVKADLATRSHVLETVNLFRAKVVDVAPDAVWIATTGTAEKLNPLIPVLEPLGPMPPVQAWIV